MKAIKMEDIRKDDVEVIRTKLADTHEELLKLRFQQVTGQLVDTSSLKVLRRNIARMETVLREAELAVVEGAQ